MHAEERSPQGAIELTADYKYDVFGNRIEKDVDSDGDGPASPEVLKFALDGWKNLHTQTVGNEAWDVWADLNADGSLKTRYLCGDVIDELFARIEVDYPALLTGPPSFWYLNDHLGSIRTVLDADGVVKDQIAYNASGGIQSETDAPYRGRYAWTGREFDVETDLQYNRARYYDVATGRWVSQDPMGFDAGDSNLYRYVNNRPTVITDPSGLREADDTPWHPRNKKLVDVLAKLEKFINSELQIIAKTASSAEGFLEKVYNHFGKDQPGSGILGKAESAKIAHYLEDKKTGLLKEGAKEITFIPFQESKYRKNKLCGRPLGAVIGNGPPSFLNLMTAKHMISPTINVNGMPIGLDKPEHLFQQGYWLWWYTNHQEKYGDGTRSLLLKSKEERLAFSAFMEGIDPSEINPAAKGLDEQTLLKMAKSFAPAFDRKGYYGSYSTGIISVADMNANESGYELYEALHDSFESWSKGGKVGAFPAIKVFKGAHKWSETVHKNRLVGTILGVPIEIDVDFGK